MLKFSPSHLSSYLCSILLILLLFSCKREAEVSTTNQEIKVETNARFTLLDSAQTGVTFSNIIPENYDYNIFLYEYMYNGGGVSIGDVNGDSLPDLYFSSFHRPNRLFINLGNLKFMDVTQESGVAAETGSKTGIAFADINGDGRLDIYACRTSKSDDGLKNDFLFINKGNREANGVQIPLFQDEAKQLGIEDNSNTNHASFFDYDRDGDLDLFLLNHKLGFEIANQMRLQQNEDGTRVRITSPDTPNESILLYQNDNGHFKDVTKKAGLVSSAFCLSAIPADINGDGWMDVYVANDYIEPDYILINNRNGSFTDHYADYLRHSSQSSMGADVTDMDNDGLVDIAVLDMKPEDPYRYKQMANIMFYDRYNLLLQYGYGRQVSRNVLQHNNGNGTFSEIGQFAGMAATDWSWSILSTDFNNDGWKDLYITNGYRKDVTELEYLNFFRDSIIKAGGLTPELFPDIRDFLKYLPEKKLSNYLYVNNTQYGYDNVTHAAGLDQLSFSNGAAYGDLDLDGDLDIVVNNIDEPAFIYRNDVSNQHWLQVVPEGPRENHFAIGAYVDVYTGNQHQYQMMITSHGYLSTSEPLLHFGLGDVAMIDSVILHWPNGKEEIMKNVKADQRIYWKSGMAAVYNEKKPVAPVPLFHADPAAIQWQHHDNDFVDLKRERLIPYNLSSEGPCMSVGDVNGDHLEDLFIGNGRGFPSSILIQQSNSKFIKATSPAVAQDSAFEDCGSILEDLDGDQDLDLVVVSGGNDLPMNDPGYMTRYYVNDGKGNFTRQARFPLVRTNGGCVLAFDFDQDQDKDLFIGGRSEPGQFPMSPKSFLLKNDNGQFTDATQNVFPAFNEIGMITDLQAGDLDGDGKAELVIVGDWMPILIFSFDGKKFNDRTEEFGLTKTNGWWRSVVLDDIDQDGDLDMLCGNMGLNNRFTTSTELPITIVTKDFDGNGSLDPVLCFYYQEKLYPFALRDAIIGQVPMLRKKYTRYNAYAKASLEDVFSKKDLSEASSLYLYTLKSTLFKNNQKKLQAIDLPVQTQWSPMFGFVINDFNHDGRKDILAAGNFIYAETETGEMDAGNGTLLLQQADGSFTYVNNREHGFWAQKEVRELKSVQLANGQEGILVANNRGPLELYSIRK